MKHNFKQLLQKYRLTAIALFVLMALTSLDVMFRIDVFNILFRLDKAYGYETNLLYLVIGSMVVLALFLNRYLSSDDDSISNTNINIENISNNGHTSELLSKTEKELKDELHRLQMLYDKLSDETRKKTGDSLNESQKEELVNTLKEQLLSSSSEELLKDLKEKTNQVIEQSISDRLEAHFNKTVQRLVSEIKSLEKRSRVNLIIGSLTAFAGVLIFVLFVFEKVDNVTAQAYLATEFAPRISLVIVIELFAYFFLGLYKSNLSEIKHFHNEVTNIEQKHMALEEALASADKDTVKDIVVNLSKTERNFLLKKGESTVLLEEKRAAIEEHKGIINALTTKIGSASK